MEPIGIVGGIGPYSALDLIKNIYDQSKASRDQDHLPICMLSIPSSIPDRTDFLLGEITENPAVAISQVISRIRANGARIIGMPCNTAHAAPIFKEIENRLPQGTRLVNMIEETAKYICIRLPRAKRVGVLSTSGARHSNVYATGFARHGLTVVQVSKSVQDNEVQPSIYSDVFGVKAKANPVTPQAIELFTKAMSSLADQSVDAIILGCTEISLAIKKEYFRDIPIIDASKALARALILESSPSHLNE